jgi:hypothetical protein
MTFLPELGTIKGYINTRETVRQIIKKSLFIEAFKKKDSHLNIFCMRA